MNERQKAKALAQALDALLGGQEGAGSISADEEIQALSELGRSLGNVAFTPSATHQAQVERLLREHRVQRERASVKYESGAHGLREVDMETPTTQKLKEFTARLLPEWLTPRVAFSAGVALSLVCTLLLIAGGVARRAWRDVPAAPEPVSVSEADLEQDVSPLPDPSAETSPAQDTTPNILSEAPYAALLPLMYSPLRSQHALLQDIRGLVEIQADDGTWTWVSKGRIIEAGQRVRTAELSGAQLVFADGSTARLGPGTEVSVDQLGRDPSDNSRVVVLTQWVGETEHDVVPAYGENARYEVHTPSGTGEAMGTSFHVLVTPDLLARFSVDEGAVSVTNLDVTVIVVAGQLTTIPAEGPPGEPVFRFTGEGEVSQVGPTWTIAGQDLETHDGTVIIGNPQVGDWVSVEGHLLPDGTRVADWIVLLRRATQDRFSITGRVEAIGDTAWTVAGQTITVSAQTEIEAGIEVKNLVRVEGLIQADGGLVAESISLIEEEPGLPFQFIGVVQDIAAEHWTISGVSITVDADTEIDAGLEVGDAVEVQGWILDDDTWLARAIERVAQERGFEFTGSVERIDPWVVAGIAFETRAWTEIEAGIEIGDRVKVTGQIMADGAWVASEVERLDDDEALYVVFVGTVSSRDPWVVSGIPLVTDGDTVIVGHVRVGALVKVRAHILPDGTWLAKKIRRLSVEPGPGCYSFSAVVVGVSGDQLTLLNGESIDLGHGVIVEGDVTVNSIVVVIVCVDADGAMTITVIVILVPPPAPPPLPPSPCGPCRGGVTNLTLRYVGSKANAHVQVVGKKDGILFSGILQPGETFSFSGSGKHGKLDKEIKLVVNGWVDATIHTSCSKPISPGVVYGSFQVVAGHSKDGGPLCVPAPAGSGDGGGGGDQGSKGSKESKGSKGCKGSKCP